MSEATTVMIAGIGGASLGTEIAKCLRLAGGYRVLGCDISPLAYGLFDDAFAETFLASRDAYVESVVALCRAQRVEALIPGGEQPTALLSAAADQLRAVGTTFLGNSAEVVARFADKHTAFDRLAAAGIRIPKTVEAHSASDVASVGVPCIVKPATGTGGSVFVFFATSVEEALVYVEYLRRAGQKPIVQEYLDPTEGEFTVGVLSLPDGTVAGSIALRRNLDAKLSVAFRGRGGVISSGYSQGLIDDFPEVRRASEAMCVAAGSRGPMNVQGRVHRGTFVPFEINPRFSASSYLRALAGFNEPDVFLRATLRGERPTPHRLRVGHYLRSLTERFVPTDQVRS